MDSLGTGTYIGEHKRTLDDKGRLTVPAAWRPKKPKDPAESAPAGTFLAIPNQSGYISVYPPERVDDLKAKLSKVGLKDRAVRVKLTRFLSKLHEFEFDKQGRINISDKLLSGAGITKDVVLLGELASFAIYNPETYASHVAGTDDELDDAFEEFDL